jgi:hypothetical protein
MRPQRFDFSLGQFTPRTWRKITERKGAFADADQAEHAQAKYTCDFPNLALFAFAHHDTQPGALGAPLEHFGPGRRRHFAVF